MRWLSRMSVGLSVALLLMSAASAAVVKVAVAANFTEPANEIARAFTQQSGHKVVLSFGSTGQLFAQISQGAPFEVFLAADQTTPRKAVDQGLAVRGTQFTYSRGRLVLFSKDPKLVTGPETLAGARFQKIAITNPVTAPYGAAAVEAMRKLGVLDLLEARIVKGTSLLQTYQFVETGNAELGFVALSQVATHQRGSRWLVPEDLHTPLAQDAVLTGKGKSNEAARAFLEFLKGAAARSTMEKFGYTLVAKEAG